MDYAGLPEMPRQKTKVALLSLRVHPNVRAALIQAAESEHRSMANMCEVMVLEGCERRGLLPNDVSAMAKSPKPKKTI